MNSILIITIGALVFFLVLMVGRGLKREPIHKTSTIGYGGVGLIGGVIVSVLLSCNLSSGCGFGIIFLTPIFMLLGATVGAIVGSSLRGMRKSKAQPQELQRQDTSDGGYLYALIVAGWVTFLYIFVRFGAEIFGYDLPVPLWVVAAGSFFLFSAIAWLWPRLKNDG